MSIVPFIADKQADQILTLMQDICDVLDRPATSSPPSCEKQQTSAVAVVQQCSSLGLAEAAAQQPHALRAGSELAAKKRALLL